MNYPIWNLPASGLLIAGIAVFHVFISHFAVGGGLFLVLAERKARREGDAAFLGYVRGLSRFFILVTLVLGAVTGVGIWFTIGLVHPQATSSLITTFVWGWAIEWTFFVAEVAAALVYYYGWDRLDPRTHVRVGWVYFWAAWLSLFVINGILSFMLTPGAWVTTRKFLDGFLNPTFVPSLFARSFAAAGIAGIYALFAAALGGDGAIKRKVVVWVLPRWVAPSLAGLGASLVWFLIAASAAGVPVGEILGAANDGTGAILLAAVSGPSEAGYPPAQRAAMTTIAALAAGVLLSIVIGLWRRGTYGVPEASALMVLGLLSLGGAEWVREGLRKPYVLGRFMFVNGVRLPAAGDAPKPPAGSPQAREDPFTVEALNREGVLHTARWSRLDAAGGDSATGGEAGDPAAPADPSAAARVAREAARGAEVFRLLCSACHTQNGYLAIRPLVRGRSAEAIDGILARLARPVDPQGRPVAWSDPGLRLATWRNRRMPPFTGTEEERRSLAVYLARIGGASDASLAAAPPGLGARVFEAACSACHAPDSEWPIAPRLRGRDAAQFHELLGRLEKVNENMPPFEGSGEERQALADYLAGLASEAAAGGRAP